MTQRPNKVTPMLQIRPYTPADRSAWDAYVLSHADGLAFHRRAWVEAVKKAYGFSDRSWVVERNGRLAGVLACVLMRRPFMKPQLVSLPYADGGGPLADDAEAAEQLLKAACTEADRVGGSLELRLSFDPEAATLRHRFPVGKVRMLLSLPESSEKLMASLKSKLRSQVRKPQRDGLTARLGGRELVETFWRIYARNMRDLGSAGITLRNGSMVSIPWASSLREFNRSNPNMLLYWTLLAHAADSGAQYFDFGRSTVGEGTYRFKKQWGAEEHPLFWIHVKDGEPRNGARPEGRLRKTAESVLERLPVACNAWLGGLVRKYISL